MKTVPEKYIEICKNETLKSPFIQKHGAVLVCRGIIIAGHNKCASFSRQHSLHAEVATIQKFIARYPKDILQHSYLLVIRTNKKGNLLNSKPCDDCKRYIEKFNIPLIYYS